MNLFSAFASQAPKLMDDPTTVPMDKLGSRERNKYLHVIDKLHEIGVGSDISLPQLVVVGDQSSGKSSLLEGITGCAFPVDSDVCTRFATQIILRRSTLEESGATISIRPGPHSVNDAQARKHLESFQRTMEVNEFEGSKVALILMEAAKHLGLPVVGSQSNTDAAPTKRFSDDHVRIEVRGPDLNHLSIVDVPGLFHNPTQYQTESDKLIIRNLVKKYISDQRTIILAVCDASSNLANQEVFQLAREADPAGKRTVGVVTKCDIVQEGDERTPMKICLNEYERLTHGWFAVRNRSTQDIKNGVTIAMRHVNENEFFDNNKPWSTLPLDRRGVDALASYLGKLQSDHFRKEFPSLSKEIHNKRDINLKKLRDLGEPRQTPTQQRSYLTSIASNYQRRVDDALCGKYWAHETLGDRLKLRKDLADLDDDLKNTMSSEGHTYRFCTVEDQLDEGYERHGSKYGGFQFEASDDGDGIYDWIRKEYSDSRGPELPGLIPPQILQTLFQQQSENWGPIACEYFEKTVQTIQHFVANLLNALINDADVCDTVKNIIELHTDDGFERARQHVNRFVNEQKDNILKTTDPKFEGNVNTIREQRLQHRLSKISFSSPNLTTVRGTILSAVTPKNREHQVVEIHDYLKAYYEVAITHFTDDIARSVVESDLIGRTGPLHYFRPSLIGGLSDEELANIAAETSLVASKRAEYDAKAERLKQALDTIRRSGI